MCIIRSCTLPTTYYADIYITTTTPISQNNFTSTLIPGYYYDLVWNFQVDRDKS